MGLAVVVVVVVECRFSAMRMDASTTSNKRWRPWQAVDESLISPFKTVTRMQAVGAA